MMNVLMVSVSSFLLYSGTLLLSASAKEENKDHSKSVSSEIQYIGEQATLPGSTIYDGSNGINRFGGLPNNYGGGLMGGGRGLSGGREILRNRFRGSDRNPNDDDGDNDYRNNQGTSGVTSYPNSGTGEEDEVANGVFSNPFLGQRRRTYSSSPDYGSSGNGVQVGYGIPYLGGSYTPQSGPLYPGFRPAGGQGYIYPVRGINGVGVGLRQPDGVYGLDIGNQYGVYPGIMRNIPASYVPTDGINGVYRGSPRGYGPALFGYGRYPELAYPGLGLEYSRLKDNTSHGSERDESVGQKPTGVPHAQPSSSTLSPKGVSEVKTKASRKEDP